MPLEILHESSSSTRIAIWHILEPATYFLSKLQLESKEAEIIDELIPKRQHERLVANYLLKILMPDEHIEILKTPQGKPFLRDIPIELSISHSGSHLAVMLSLTPCGIDIQYYTPKIAGISRRFMLQSESQLLESLAASDLMHLIWSSKEVAYKIYALKQLDFLKNIKVSKSTEDSTNALTAQVSINAETYNYRLYYYFYKSYVLVYGQ